MFAKAEVGTYHDVYYFAAEAAAAVFDYSYQTHCCQLSALAACTNSPLQPRAESLDLKCFSELPP